VLCSKIVVCVVLKDSDMCWEKDVICVVLKDSDMCWEKDVICVVLKDSDMCSRISICSRMWYVLCSKIVICVGKRT
jgi:hypothetical protein